ncbi:hypothetical protein JYQ62_16120 [Nostoc sp. UHCC 0702]|nr:hypothetical protein JYQ62_16120 [Nostoc sp. UHCC 0702]
MMTYRKFLEFKAKAVNASIHQDPVIQLGYEVTYGGLVKFQLKFQTPQRLLAELVDLDLISDKLTKAICMSAIAYCEYISDFVECTQKHQL